MWIQAIKSVNRTKGEAKRFYDDLSEFYDNLVGSSERRIANKALDRLNVRGGESVLEIGFGTGRCLQRISKSVGQRGRSYGIDISFGMSDMARRRLKEAGLMERTDLCGGDGASLPYGEGVFDAVFMSFTLELFDTPEIPRVLREIERVLKKGGRLGIVSMSRENGGVMMRLYEWAHGKWPKYVDCRPIYLEEAIMNAGYSIEEKERARIFRLPIEIVIAIKAFGHEPGMGPTEG